MQVWKQDCVSCAFCSSCFAFYTFYPTEALRPKRTNKGKNAFMGTRQQQMHFDKHWSPSLSSTTSSNCHTENNKLKYNTQVATVQRHFVSPKSPGAQCRAQTFRGIADLADKCQFQHIKDTRKPLSLSSSYDRWLKETQKQTVFFYILLYPTIPVMLTIMFVCIICIIFVLLLSYCHYY